MQLEAENISQAPKKILGLSKNIFMLGLTSFFNDFSNEMIVAAFPAFFTSVLKAGAASLGMVEGIADGVANILKIYSGNLSDKLQRHRVFIFIGYGLSVAIRPLYILVGSVSAVLGLRVTDRVGKGIREAPRDVIISASTPAGEIGRSFGYHRAMDAAGGILGPLGAYLILSRFPVSLSATGFTVIFMTASILGLFAVLTIFFVTDIAKVNTQDGSRLFSLSAVRSLSPAFRTYLVAVFLLSVGSLPVTVLLLKTTSIGLMIADIPLFYMAYSVAYTGFSYLGGKKSDTLGTAKVLIVGYLLLIVSYVVIGLAFDALILTIAFVILGVFSAATDSTQRAWTGRVVALEHRGTAYGLFQAAIGFGAMLAGIVGGWLWQAYSPAAALWAGAIVVAIGIIVLLFSMRAHVGDATELGNAPKSG